jgi:hypothetical protein
MIIALDDRGCAEIRRFSLVYTCERCAQFEPENGGCSAGYPNGEHREAPLESGRRLVFCKEFELA